METVNGKEVIHRVAGIRNRTTRGTTKATNGIRTDSRIIGIDDILFWSFIGLLGGGVIHAISCPTDKCNVASVLLMSNMLILFLLLVLFTMKHRRSWIIRMRHARIPTTFQTNHCSFLLISYSFFSNKERRRIRVTAQVPWPSLCNEVLRLVPNLAHFVVHMVISS